MPDLEILKVKLENHINENKKDSANLTESLKHLSKTVDKIKDNHLEHMQKDMADMNINITRNSDGISRLEGRINRLEKLQWYMLTVGITTLIGIVVNTYLTLS